MFRIWPSFARKNFFTLVSFRTERGRLIQIPLPLFMVDTMVEPIMFLMDLGLVRGLIKRKASNLLPYVGMIDAGAKGLGEMWKSLRWRGTFTLFEVETDNGPITIKFV